ncbi:integrin alpha-6-like protein [Lates japonicus]|uniref:Integrin alpha-6-like protein n=1 Tax=Lates japonicus TaxID=270547 RepID=A0AAD3RJ25_LATJO|nr:integrin alpha-6-like protein [Lates japonicus]
MAKHWHMVYLWSVWHFQTLNVAAFNLDTNNVLQRNGDPGSLFGFSVAFHQQLSPTKKNLLLVGAPRSKHQNQTCAHRYQQWSPNPSENVSHLLTGQCYLLGNDLKVGIEDRTWRRVVCDNDYLTKRPMHHDWFAYCQQGHGASFAKDNKSVLFGAPGAYHWKGIVRMELLDNLGILSENPRETGDIGHFNVNLIPLKRDSYLGFSIDSGMALIRKGELTIVSGAPRGGYSGQVTFLKADPAAKINLAVELVLSGPGLASSFGYDVAVVDFSGDGWEDLAVGAPQFCVKNDSVGGAVYVYINNKGKNWKDVVPTQLLGDKDSMFGLAVENIGDINQDVLNYTFKADAETRVNFLGSPQGKLELPGQRTNVCTDIKLQLLRNIKDKLRSIPVSVNVSLLSSNETTRTSADLPNVTLVPNLYQQESTVSEIILINRGCGSDNICQSNLELQYKFCSTKTQKEQNVFKSLAREDGVAVITPSKEDIALEITVTNRNGDDAHQSRLIIRLPDTLHYSSIVYSKAATCSDGLKCVEIRCPLLGLDSTEVILHSRLWNTTFTEVIQLL